MASLRELQTTLTAIPEIEFALLFGSRATGTHRPNSDWDVAVHLRSDLSDRERFRLRLRLAARLEDYGRADVVVLNDAPPLLAHRALMGRRLLVRNKPALVRFSIRTLALSEDERPWRELHQRMLRQRLQEGRFGRP